MRGGATQVTTVATTSSLELCLPTYIKVGVPTLIQNITYPSKLPYSHPLSVALSHISDCVKMPRHCEFHGLVGSIISRSKFRNSLSAGQPCNFPRAKKERGDKGGKKRKERKEEKGKTHLEINLVQLNQRHVPTQALPPAIAKNQIQRTFPLFNILFGFDSPILVS